MTKERVFLHTQTGVCDEFVANPKGRDIEFAMSEDQNLPLPGNK